MSQSKYAATAGALLLAAAVVSVVALVTGDPHGLVSMRLDVLNRASRFTPLLEVAVRLPIAIVVVCLAGGVPVRWPHLARWASWVPWAPLTALLIAALAVITHTTLMLAPGAVQYWPRIVGLLVGAGPVVLGVVRTRARMRSEGSLKPSEAPLVFRVLREADPSIIIGVAGMVLVGIAPSWFLVLAMLVAAVVLEVSTRRRARGAEAPRL